MTTRRSFVALLAASALAPALAATQAFPSQPITLVVPFPPGGVTDITARIVAQALEKKIGANIVVENRGGAGGNIGASVVARAKADGYTLLYGTQGVLAANPYLYKSINFDVQKDFTPVGLTYETAHMLVVRPDLPARTTEEFITLAKASPGKLVYGSSGVGGGSHLFMEYFQHSAGIKLLHAPYKGGGPALTDLLGGRLDAMLDSIPSAATQVKAGKLRALGVSGAQRDPEFPDVPTLAEGGAKDFAAVSWGAIMAPAGTPDDVVRKLSLALSQAIDEPGTRKLMAERGASVNPSTPEQAAQRIAQDQQRWSTVIREAGISAE
ncbi:Bug family tripartite tricarboxylate transporter substrate binding protein [Bordetella bronchiseptica]|uniref:Bug family tripartite tricarboxylate transporter substrate binding protein n=1 Tax=Bordetella bronchiseptica TaxID=518 RepID=UPI0002900EB1|nr:tripartite tricarboxylate transporter substrate binding protein [Bordetella bronchiseptica]KAK75395.1 tripartite tricarboxylate transporter family receptor [Bordetella bronchiseptica MO211]CCN20200.1 putative exported protein [Bordetella bronchiseptica MO211]